MVKVWWCSSCEQNRLQSIFFYAAWHWVTWLPSVSEGGTHSAGDPECCPTDEMKQVNFSLGLKWNEKQMSWRVTESVCVLSAQPMWVMALIWPPAPRLFIILRWQGGAGKRRALGAPSWSITLEVSFPSYLTITWITAALVYRCQPFEWVVGAGNSYFALSPGGL